MVALIGDAELDEGNVYEACRRVGSTTSATSGG
jgi:transketolase N-terminal domain/subunit